MMLRVLIVDDCPDTAGSLGVLTRIWGHEARTATDGSQAIREAVLFHPDIVLLDLGMPQPNGFEVARQLRKVPGLERVMLVALTGHGRPQDRDHASQAGFDYFMLKPFKVDQLEQLLKARAACLTPAEPALN
jgi:CheY-like chemotaxis protein